MISYVATALVAAVSASAADFPAFDSQHADCKMTVTYPGMTCDSLYVMMDYEIRSWSAGGPSDGLYAMVEEQEPSYIWATRTTPVAKYVDDIIFEMSQDGNTCVVAARSRSETLSMLDYSTNYCNMWNVLENLGGMTAPVLGECVQPPTDPEYTCAIY